jgi:hypothetical protein
VTRIGRAHERVAAGGGAAGIRLQQFKAINTVLRNLETALTGNCRAFDFAKYGHRYLAEAQYRFNCSFNLAALPTRLLRATAITRRSPFLPLERLRYVANQVRS